MMGARERERLKVMRGKGGGRIERIGKREQEKVERERRRKSAEDMRGEGERVDV